MSNGTVVKNSMRKNQLTIREKADQLFHDYKIKFNPFLAKECGYSLEEIQSYFGITPDFTIPAAPRSMPPATIDSEETEDA